MGDRTPKPKTFRMKAIAKVQAMVRRHVPEGYSVIAQPRRNKGFRRFGEAKIA
jgi:hypothetical protein